MSLLSAIFVVGALESHTLAHAQESRNSSSHNLSVSLSTDKAKYVRGEQILVHGQVHNMTGSQAGAQITLTAIKIDNERNPDMVIYRTATFSTNGNYTIGPFTLDEPAMYNITVTARTDSDMRQSIGSAWIVTRTVNPLWNHSAWPLYAGAVFIVLLFVTIRWPDSTFDRELRILRWFVPVPKMSWETREVLRFLFLSSLPLAFIVSTLIVDVEVGANSPVGLVVRHAESRGLEGDDAQDVRISEWVMNVGGSQENGYIDGIQIPVYVLIFGIAGGYVRYLYSTARRQDGKHKEIRKIQDKIDKAESKSPDSFNRNEKNVLYRQLSGAVFFQSLYDIMLFFLAPLLAIALWFILFQGGTTGIHAIAAVSFTIGLVTDEVVKSLVKYTKLLLRSENNQGRNNGPSILLAPGSGSAGMTITISGKNFTADSEVSFYLDGTLVLTDPLKVTSDEDGSFNAKYQIQTGTATGVHALRAQDASDVVADTSLTVM